MISMYWPQVSVQVRSDIVINVKCVSIAISDFEHYLVPPRCVNCSCGYREEVANPAGKTVYVSLIIHLSSVDLGFPNCLGEFFNVDVVFYA